MVIAIIKYTILPMVAFYLQWLLTVFVKERYISKTINSEPMISFLSNFGWMVLGGFVLIFLANKFKIIKHSIKFDYVIVPIVSTLICTIIYHMDIYQEDILSLQIYSELPSQSFIFYAVCQVWFMTLFLLISDHLINKYRNYRL